MMPGPHPKMEGGILQNFRQNLKFKAKIFKMKVEFIRSEGRIL